MDLTGKLKPGMRVVGADRTEYGTVERYDDTTVYVDGRPIPYGAFERLEQGRLYLRQGGVRPVPTDRETQAMAREDELRIPLVEERLEVSTRTVELGEVEVRTTVESEHVSVPIELRRDQIAVRQVDVEDRPLTIGEGLDAFEQDMIRVPVRGEEVLASKQAVVTGEVAIGRDVLHERHTVTETVRQEVVDVSVSHDEAHPEFREHADRLQAGLHETGGPTFHARRSPQGKERSFGEAGHGDGRARDGREIAPSVAVGDASPGPDEVLRVPEVEEQLRVERRRIALGFVEIRKTVVTEQVMVPVEVRREVVEYRLIDDPGGVATIGEAPGDLRDDTIRIPVFRERPVIQTETVVASEIVIDRSLTVDRQALDETLRRTRITVEDNTAPWEPMQGLPEHDGPLGAHHGEAVTSTDRTKPSGEVDEKKARQRDVRRLG
jgi:uncharacterized protein (TIGR02271 family)